MTFKINISAPDGTLSFAHQPGSVRPLRLMSAPSTDGRLLGLFLEEAWNQRPLELLDAVAQREPASWDAWKLEPDEKEQWRLQLSNLSSTIPDGQLREAVCTMAACCLAGIHVVPTAPESEVAALEHRRIRLHEPEELPLKAEINQPSRNVG